MIIDSDLTNRLQQQISKTRKAAIITHHNPDGDAVGSSLALYHYLLKKGIKPEIFFSNMYPDFLSWMITDENLSVYNNKNEDVIKNRIMDADTIFCLDFNSFHRAWHLKPFLKTSKAYKILIDHHTEPDSKSFDLTFSTTQTSATASLLFDIIASSGDTHLMDKKMAEFIYVGMATDTGSFSYNANYTRTYDILSQLFSLGIDGAHIQHLVYNNFTEKRMRLFGLCLNQNLTVRKEHKTAYITLPMNDLKEYSYKPGDTEGIVNYALAIKGIEMSALFIERKDLIRVSLRSYGNLNVNKIAADLFNGGGHKNAAGANSKLSLADTIKKFETHLPKIDNYRT